MGNILVNEIGYRPSDSKIAVYRGDNAGEYAVINQDGKVVLSGEIVNYVDDEGASERDYSIDFSDVKEEGKYKVIVGDESSEEFVITDDVYNQFRAQLDFDSYEKWYESGYIYIQKIRNFDLK